MDKKLLETMRQQASNALTHAYAPYSKYRVAACVCSESGDLFTGVNVENSAYGLTVCAETSAICQMVAKGERQIQHLVLLAGDNALCTPCGACRQRIYELATPNTRIYLCDQTSVLKTLTIDDLLPFAFRLKI